MSTRRAPLQTWPTYVGVCCREWDLAVGIPVGRCGLCGTRPTVPPATPATSTPQETPA